MDKVYHYSHIAAYYRHKAAHDWSQFAEHYGLADAYRIASTEW